MMILRAFHAESMERGRELCNRRAFRSRFAAMKRLVLSLVLIAASTGAFAAPALLDRAKIDRLDHLAIGSHVVVDGFPDGFGGQSSLTFERIDVYARGARVIVVDANGEHELAKSKRMQLIGKNAAGDVRVSLAFDPGVVNVHGVGTSTSGTFVVSAERS